MSQVKRSFNDAFASSATAAYSAPGQPAYDASLASATAAAGAPAVAMGSASIMGTVIQSAHIAASLSDTTGPQRSETQQQLAAVVSTYQPECPSCRTNVYVVEDAQRGANICRQCGIQIGGQLISEGSEWRSFADDGTSSHNDPSRVAGPDDEFFGLGTVFVGANGLSTRAQLGQTPEQRTLLNIIGVCRRMRLQLNLPESVLEEAQRIARVVVSAPAELRGKTIKTDSMGAACMFLAAGNKGVGVKKDVAQASASVSEKAMNKQLSRVKAILSKHDPLHVARTDSTLAPLHFVERYCNEWRLPPEIADAARAVITTAKRMDVAASALPANYAAAAIYFCVLLKELPTPLKTIAATCSATQDTLLKIARDLYNRRLAIVPKDFVDPLALERMRRP